MGHILDLVIRDTRNYLKGGFSIPLSFDTGTVQATLNGLATVHSQGFDQDERPIVAENSHICFSETEANEAGLITRNAKGDLDIENWKVEFDHNVGHVIAKLSEPFPDSTLGIIRVQITRYGVN